MADIILNCPHCQQPIQCDTQWGGQQIQCPLCQGALIVPQEASAPAPAPATSGGAASYGKQLVTPPAGNKLAFQHNAQQPATAGRNIPIRDLAPAPEKKKSPLVKIVVGAVVLVAVAAGGYFGWTKYQERVEAKKAEEARQAEAEAKAAKEREKAAKAASPTAPAANAPITPPVYTLDVATAQIPQCAVNGLVAGSNFVAQMVQLNAVGSAQVLRLTQGTPNQPDREMLLYFSLRPGEKLSDHTWTISPDMKGAGVPRVIKRWTVKAGYAPARKDFASGYAMKLEFGQLANGVLPGKVFLALPDQEQSVAGGVFQAMTTLNDVIGAAPAPGGAPASGVAPTAPRPTAPRPRGGGGGGSVRR